MSHSYYTTSKKKKRIELLKWAKKILNDYNLCLKILSIVEKKEIPYIYSHLEDEISNYREKKFKNIIKKLSENIPLAYILKKEKFFGFEFKIKEGVFIPRPETEFLIEYVLKKLNLNGKLRVLDIGTGSGAIAIVLKKLKKNLKVFASDISIKALFCAKENSKKHKIKLNMFCGDILNCIKGKFDLILSNPPYIKKSDLKKLPENVKKEPLIALDGGFDGTRIIKKILFQARKNLKKNGILIFEIGEGEEEIIKENAKKLGYNLMDVVYDYSNKERVLVFEWSG